LFSAIPSISGDAVLHPVWGRSGQVSMVTKRKGYTISTKTISTKTFHVISY